MIKKVLIAIILLVLVGGVFFTYERFFSKKSKIVSDLIELAPSNSALIINVSSFVDLKKTLKENKIWADLGFTEICKDVNSKMDFIYNLIKDDKKLQKVLHNNIMVTFNKKGKNKITNIFFFNLNDLFVKDDAAYNYLKSLLLEKYKVEEKTYNGFKIMKVGDKTTFYILIVGDVVIVTPSSVYIEMVARGIKSGYSALKRDETLKKIVSTSGKNVVANIYVNYKEAVKLFSPFFVGNYRYAAKKLKIADWSEFDVTLKESLITFNGFTIADDSIPKYFMLFKKQLPVSNEMEEIIPSSVIAFVLIGISDPLKFRNSYEDYLKYNLWYDDYEKSLKKYNKLLGLDVRDIFYSFLDDEIGLVYLSPQTSDIERNTFMVVKTVSKRLATEEMQKILNAHAEHFGNKKEDYVSYFSIDEETKIPVYSFPIYYFGKLLFGDIFGKVETSYFTFVDNYMILGSSKKELKSFILDNIHGRTLESDLEYKEFKETLSEKSNFYVFSRISDVYPIAETYFNENISSLFLKNREKYKHIYGLGFQVQGGDDLLYASLSAYYNPDVRERPHTVWATLLDTTIDFKPQLVINHNTNKKEIILQDEKNYLYLINSAGRILWKLYLPEKIKSKIYQIDFYKNNKLQYLFNTKTKLYLIDRNGNFVEHYPITLRSPATNGISVFDYENNKDYRIFVAGEDKHIYLYDKEGNIVTGWKFGKTDAKVNSRIQHFKIGTKDYIVFADSMKTYILNRRGEDRIKVKKFFSKSPKNKFYLLKNEGNYFFVTTDRSGIVYYIDLDGNITTKDFGRFSPDHYFKLLDVDKDGYKDYIFSDKNVFVVYDMNKNKKFEYQFENKILYEPIIFKFPNNVVKIGIVDRMASLIYLFNSDGSIYNDFPLEGNSPFTIGHFNNNSLKFNLIVGGRDSFLFNYEVN